MEFHFPRRGEPVADPDCADGKDSSHTGKRRAARSVRVSHRLTPTGTLRRPGATSCESGAPACGSHGRCSTPDDFFTALR